MFSSYAIPEGFHRKKFDDQPKLLVSRELRCVQKNENLYLFAEHIFAFVPVLLDLATQNFHTRRERARKAHRAPAREG